MHYFSFNIADYRKDTQHLTPIEHYIYRELIDWYYLDELPIPTDTRSVLRRLRLPKTNETDLAIVLKEFFTETENGWFHARISAEIDVYKSKSDRAKVNGRKGGRPSKAKRTQGVNSGLAKKTQPKANHKPITNNHKPLKSGAFAPPSVEQVIDYLADKSAAIDPGQFVDYYAAQGWKLANGRKMVDWKAAVRTWIKREENNNGANRPRTNTGAAQRKQTPAERVRQRHAELYGGDAPEESPIVGSVVAIQ